MKKCVFLSMDSFDGFVVSDHFLFEPMKQKGWDVQEISWRAKDVNWSDYDVVVVRSTWDYMKDKEAFLKVLEEIDQSDAHLENSLDILGWNIEKTYLKEVEERGVACIPTLWCERFDIAQEDTFFDRLGVDEIVIKPILSAGARDTFRIKVGEFSGVVSALQDAFSDRAFMVQPFLKEIIDPGEFSLFYFGGEHSHTIQKKPKENDYRVQEEHGGILSKVDPDVDMLAVAEKALALMDEMPLYARVDLVPYDGAYRLMELELIEPSLYFDQDEEAAPRFADVFDRWMRSKLA